MTDINESLNELFDSWQSDAYDNGDTDFVFDGLLNDSCFDDSEWWDSNLRIAFVTKDPYFQGDYDEGDLDGEDYREYDLLEMAGDHRFWRNIVAWAYGLIQTDEDGYPDYDEASDYENMEYIANNIPIALVNIKKEAGSSTVSNSTLRWYAREYDDYLKQELQEILCPNVIFCCGTSGIVMDEIYDEYDFEQIDDDGFVYYCEDQDILLIAGYHPTARMSNYQMYNSVMNAYSDFLEDYYFPNN